MITLKIKVKVEAITYEKKLFVSDNYVISKSNDLLTQEIQKACLESNIKNIKENGSVKLFITPIEY